VRNYGVHCERVFDTQIAHRHMNRESVDPKDMNINLNSLLLKYLRVENSEKEAIVSLMK
jgi:hypothetical protein